MSSKYFKLKWLCCFARGYLLTDFEFVFVVSFHLKLCIGSSLASTATTWSSWDLENGYLQDDRFLKTTSVGSTPPNQDGSCKSEFMWIPYLLTVVIMVVTVTGWGANPNNRAMFVPCFTFYDCGRVVLEWIFCGLLMQQQVEMGPDTTVMRRAVVGISMEVWLGTGLEKWPKQFG